MLGGRERADVAISYVVIGYEQTVLRDKAACTHTAIDCHHSSGERLHLREVNLDSSLEHLGINPLQLTYEPHTLVSHHKAWQREQKPDKKHYFFHILVITLGLLLDGLTLDKEFYARLGSLFECSVCHAQSPSLSLEDIVPDTLIVPHLLNILEAHSGDKVAQNEL